MALPADYHMHTPLCHHATGEPTEYAARAVALGLTEIGFSDHSPMRQDNFDEWRMNFDKLGRIRRKSPQGAKRFSPTHHPPRPGSGLSSRPGGMDPRTRRHASVGLFHRLRALRLARIGPSTIPPNSPNGKNATPSKSGPFISTGSRAPRIPACLKSSATPICPKNSASIPKQDCTPLFERFLQTAARKNVAIELNTAGLRKDCKEIYPSPQIVRLAKQHNVPITFGSDAHAPGEVGMNFAEAIQLARSAGYTQCCRFIRAQTRNGFVLSRLGEPLDSAPQFWKTAAVKQTIVTLDLEGVLVPEIWIAVAEKTGIRELRLTTRDIPDYDVLMKGRLNLLDQHGLKLSDIQQVISTLAPARRRQGVSRRTPFPHPGHHFVRYLRGIRQAVDAATRLAHAVLP